VKYGFIRRHAPVFPVRRLCEVLGVSASGYYRFRGRPESRRSREDRRLRLQIRTIHREMKGRYGSPRIYEELRARGVRCSRKRVARLMREEHLQGRRRRRYRVTTQSAHRHAVAPNRLNRQFRVEGPNRVWAGDITYLWTEEGWLYLAVLLDLFSRRVVGWAVSARIDGALTLSALRMALEQDQPPQGLLHHSDRGSQYAAGPYQAVLRRYGLEVSMSRAGNCYDNAVVESFFSTLKLELEGIGRYRTRQEAYREVFDYIERFYNPRRRHSSLGYLSPAQFEKAQKERTEKFEGLGEYPAQAVYP
jgi:putative transposase